MATTSPQLNKTSRLHLSTLCNLTASISVKIAVRQGLLWDNLPHSPRIMRYPHHRFYLRISCLAATLHSGPWVWCTTTACCCQEPLATVFHQLIVVTNLIGTYRKIRDVMSFSKPIYLFLPNVRCGAYILVLISEEAEHITGKERGVSLAKHPPCQASIFWN